MFYYVLFCWHVVMLNCLIVLSPPTQSPPPPPWLALFRGFLFHWFYLFFIVGIPHSPFFYFFIIGFIYLFFIVEFEWPKGKISFYALYE